MNARCIFFNASTGKCVTDSTPRCGDRGEDAGYCAAVTGDASIHSCKANPEGSHLTACDDAFLGVACPIWQYSVDNGTTWSRCVPDGLGPAAPFSCDHLDGWDESQGVYTGRCERAPDGLRAPLSGFSAVPHGKGQVRACNAAGTVCSGLIAVDY